MMMRGTKIIVASEQRDYHRKRLEVVIFHQRPDGSEFIAEPLTFRDCTNQLIEKPTFDDGREFLQAALDHAWSIGMRPAGFADVPLQTAALTAHLNDMRALVFNDPRHISPDAMRVVPRRSDFPGEQ